MLIPTLSTALGEKQRQDGITGQVKASLKRMPVSGRPEIGTVSRDLGSLQQRITAEGATYRTLLADARREMGEALLSDPRIDIREVPYLLGYQDNNSFYRAFRACTSVTHGRWRRDALRSA
jgi:AraC-like DNA-binding protein